MVATRSSSIRSLGRWASSSDTAAMLDASMGENTLRERVQTAVQEIGENIQFRRFARLAGVAAYTAPQRAMEGRATAYVCRDFACRAPTTEIREMLEALSADGS